MKHFLKIKDGKVINSLVLNDSDAMTETQGQDFIKDVLRKDGLWLQTCPDCSIRGNHGGIGMFYDSEKDVFYHKQNHASWTLDDNGKWQPPTPRPSDQAFWDEENQSWIV